jgi:hypothetical protein
MPRTVKTYIDGLKDKTSTTPLKAQASAFMGLVGVTGIAGIKSAYPDEELFSDLKDPKESKATRGILGAYRENKDLLEVCDEDILSSKENFTVWLVKKIYLEGKTLDEINEDLAEEINPEFKKVYEDKEINEQAIKSSTLKALGIQTPSSEYMQSLRYTRDGYSDMVGEKISQVQKAFWESMPIEERTARAKKSVENYEKWWNSFSRDEILDMIAAQEDEIDLLKRFHDSEMGKSHQATKSQQTEIPKRTEGANKVHVGSKLSKDDLFKIWAANNLRIFQEGLTE